MKSSALFAAAVAIYATGASAQIRFSFSRQYRSKDSKSSSNAGGTAAAAAMRSTDRRQTLPLEFSAIDWTYVVNASVGTPPQDVQLALTVSADKSWVYDAEYGYDWGYGAFLPNKSSTFERSGEDSFSVQYIDGNYAYGDDIRDTLWVGGAALPNLTMGFASWTTMRMGVLALGFNDSFSDVPNVPDLMVAEGLVESPAFSLWIDDENATSGNVLFGAVDRAAFEPPLVRFPIYSHDVEWRDDHSWDVSLVSLNYSATPGGTAKPLIDNQTAVEETVLVVDPSFSVSTLPSYLAQPIWDLAGATYDDGYGLALIPCAAASNLTGRLVLQLYGPDGPVLDVPLRDLVLDSEYWDQYHGTGATRCVFGVANGTSTLWSVAADGNDYGWALGAPMLKRVYTVFDVANRELGMAQVKFDDGEEDLVTFSAYGAKIPDSTLAKKPCDDRYRYCPDDDDNGRRTRFSDRYDPGLSGAPLVGVVIGSIVAGALIVLGIIWAVMACYRRKLVRAAEVDNEKGHASAATAAPATTDAPVQPPALPPRPPAAPIDVAAVTGEAPQSEAEPQRAPPSLPSSQPQPIVTSDAEKAEASRAGQESPEASSSPPAQARASNEVVEPTASQSAPEPERTPPSPPQSPAPHDTENGKSSRTGTDKDEDEDAPAPGPSDAEKHASSS